MSTQERPVSTAAVADLVGVREKTVRRWCGTGDIAATKIGGRWFVPAAEFHRIQKALAVPA